MLIPKPVLKANEMRDLDNITINKLGIEARVLMENAGRSVASVIMDMIDVEGKKIIVVAGKGNNGGDGFVAARYLADEGANVGIYLIGREDDVKGPARKNLKTLKKMNIDFVEVLSEEELEFMAFDLTTADVIVDAIFGTGFKGRLQGIYMKIVEMINMSDAITVSVDIPSGVDSDTGEIGGAAVMADATVTMAFPKLGHVLYPGKNYTGRLIIANIGIPRYLTDEKANRFLLEEPMVSDLIPIRFGSEHKGNLGRVLVVAGSRGYTGAAALASTAAMRVGAGLTYLAIPKSLNDILEAKVTEVITIPVDEEDGAITEKAVDELLSDKWKFDVAAIGPGLGRSEHTRKAIIKFISNFKGPIVIDADAVVALEGNLDVITDREIPPILTPHPGEMAHLIPNMDANEINKKRVDVVEKFVSDTGVVLALKGAPTVIGSPFGEIFINTTGNPGLASGGTGDVLTGMIAGFLAQGVEPIGATLLGVYMHGLVGDIVAIHKGEHSLMASDLLDHIPEAFKLLLGEEEVEEED